MKKKSKSSRKEEGDDNDDDDTEEDDPDQDEGTLSIVVILVRDHLEILIVDRNEKVGGLKSVRTIQSDCWHHIVVCRNADTLMLYVLELKLIFFFFVLR